MSDLAIDFKIQMAEARRTQILMGAAQVFAEKGYHKATTKQIAKAAGVSEGTIYNYFENKRELLVAMIDNLGMQSVRTIVTEEPPDDPREYLTAVLKDRYQFAEAFGSRLMPIIAEMSTDPELRDTVYSRIATPMASYVEAFIDENVKAGRFKPVNSVIATRSFVGVIFINFALKISGMEPRYNHISEDELIDQLVSIFLGGLLVNETNQS